MLPSRILPACLLATALVVPASLVATVGTATSATAAARPTCHGLRATIVGTARADRLVGTARRDVIVGLGGADRIDGRGGNDVICGGDGGDVISGGPGADRIETGTQGRTTTRDGSIAVPDEVAGGPGDDTLVLDADTRPAGGDIPGSYSVLTFRHSARGVRVSLGDGRRGTARGEGRDTLVLHERVRLVGSPHDDQLVGGPGTDVIFGGTGNDVVRGMGGDDDLTGDPFTLTGALPSERDQVFGGDGDDRIVAHTGSDVLHGDAGADTVQGASDQGTQVFGDDGDDQLSVDLLTGTGIDGGAGTDRAQLHRPLGVPASPDPVVVHTARGTLTQGALTIPATGIEAFDPEHGLTLQYDAAP